jgi:hypothetical protein
MIWFRYALIQNKLKIVIGTITILPVEQKRLNDFFGIKSITHNFIQVDNLRKEILLIYTYFYHVAAYTVKCFPGVHIFYS